MSEHVEFRDLKYIAAVAEAGSFTRAAEGLYVAQPSLSKQIKDVEIETGVQIFERQRDGVFPTPVGQMIVDYANATLAERKHVFRLAREITLGAIPPLRVGFSCFVNSRHLQALRSLYEKHFPSCILQLSGGDTVHVLHRMERGDLDCALLQMPVEGPKWVVEQIASAPLVVCMRSDDELADRAELSLQELAQRLTIFRDPDAHPLAHTKLTQRLAEAGVPVNVACSAATPQDIQLLVCDGYGWALVDADIPSQSNLTRKPISGVAWTSETALVFSTENRHPALSYLRRHLTRATASSVRKDVRSERPQYALKFDLLA